MKNDYNEKVYNIINQMTLEEKASLCSGRDYWNTKSIDRLGIPSVLLSDGPHGLRKYGQNKDGSDNNESEKAVCFPCACAAASSFDRDLIYLEGETIGRECRAADVSILLGPAINIKRSPLCGRNFEYYSEDPYLAGELAASYIKGLQSQNVGACLKHFAVNNQEYRRMTINANVDECTFREIYLPAFEKAVETAKPWSIMVSYNKLNGDYVSENHRILTKILRDEWGFDGFTVSDWGSVNNRVKALQAGLELEMPAMGSDTDEQIVKAVRNGEISQEVLNKAVERILRVVLKCAKETPEKKEQDKRYDFRSDHEIAVTISQESAILLKNENNMLPLDFSKKIAIIGEFAKKPRFQGCGSSRVNSFLSTCVTDNIAENKDIDFIYAKGFSSKNDIFNENDFNHAVDCAEKCDAAVIFAGLPNKYESESYDREHMRLPDCQNRLIERICSVQKNVIVVLHNGAPVEMPWIDKVKAVLEMYLGGQGVGTAAYNLLFGIANPCGKLAETFPKRLCDNPSYLNFPGDDENVNYCEGIYVGYRYYDKKEIDVLFPFGHGLSYTNFEYSNLKINKKTATDKQTVRVTADIKNTGERFGKEVVQLYVKNCTGSKNCPVKELRDFKKVGLMPGETKRVEFVLDMRAFSRYNTKISDFHCDDGKYEILIGSSSKDIRLTGSINIKSTSKIPFVIDQNTTVEDLLNNPKISDYVSRILNKYINISISKTINKAINKKMTLKMTLESPLRSLRNMTGISQEKLDNKIKELNDMLKE